MRSPAIHLPGLLPGLSASPSRISARHMAIGVASLASGTCGLVGLYPQFDHGSLRVIIGLGAGAFGALVMWLALKIRSRVGSAFAVLGLGLLVGVLNTVLPILVLWSGKSSGGELGMLLFFGLMFGAPTGFAYGVPLAILAALVHRPVYGSSFDATDRGKVRASVWSLVIAIFATYAAVTLSSPFETTMVAMLLASASLIFGALTAYRWHGRSKWTARVREGREPSLRLRALAAYDPMGLPRLGDGATVVEWTPAREGDHPQSYESIYRVSACGVPLAIVADPR